MRLLPYCLLILLTTLNTTTSCMKRPLEDVKGIQAIVAAPRFSLTDLPSEVQKRLIALNPIKNVMRLVCQQYHDWVRWENKEALLTEYPDMPMNFSIWSSIMPTLCANNQVDVVKALCAAQPKAKEWLGQEDLNKMETNILSMETNILSMVLSDYSHTQAIIEILKEHSAPFSTFMHSLNKPFELDKLLHDAVLLNNIYGVQKYLDMYHDAKTPFETKALSLACVYRRYAIAQLLITYGATSTNIQFKDNQTLLHVAATYSTDSFLRLLLNTDAKQLINARNDQGETPLMVALSSSQSTSDIVTLLLEHGADINMLDAKLKVIPLWSAIHDRKPIEKITALLNAKQVPVNIHHIPEDGGLCCALSLAVQDEDHELVSLLIKHGARITTLEPDNMTPLKRAIKQLDLPMVKHLLAQGKPEITGNTTMIPEVESFCLDLFLQHTATEEDKEILNDIARELAKH
jgi:hypothetical protein